MTIVLTNDDGINAPGLQRLKTALREAGHNVVVVAPAANQSGVSRAATYANAVRVRRVSRTDRDYAVQGTPVDCVRAALVGQVAPDASLVISGINHGANLGDDTFNSGTVGAAIEAAILGVPAMAISQQSHPGFFHILDALDQSALIYDATAEVGVCVAEALLEDPPAGRCVVNVNTPATSSYGGVAVTRLGARHYERGSFAPIGSTENTDFYLIYGAPEDGAPGYDRSPGTDFAALEEGLISISALSYEHGDAINPFTDWVQGLTDRVSASLPIGSGR